MEDKAFLQYALEQAFLNPLPETPTRIKSSASVNDFYFSDNESPEFDPYILSRSQLQKFASNAKNAVYPRQNKRLYAEYEIYKHDLTENIVMPSNFPNIKEIAKQLDLQRVNRQSAQKKKITATIFPSDFTAEFKKITLQYVEILKQCNIVLNRNQAAVHLSLITDFAILYTQITKKFSLSHFTLRLNHKRMLFYINEAAQLLKTHQRLSDDFCQTHNFFGEKLPFTRHAAAQCRFWFSQLIHSLQNMTDDTRLYELVQALLVSRQRYTDSLKKYRAENPADNVEQITAIRHNMQELFKSYAFLWYLNGVRSAFENNYLNEAPQQRNPELLTVSPQDEVKKISKIVEESRKIKAVSGKIDTLYASALKKYDTIHQKLQQMLSAK